MALIPTIKDGDWRGLRQALSLLASKLGPSSEPTFAGLKLGTQNGIVTATNGTLSASNTLDLGLSQ